MPRDAAPATYVEFDRWWEAKLASPELHATPHALAFAPLVAFCQPVPPGARLNLAAQNLIIKGTLPPRVREIYAIGWGAAQERSFRALARAHRAAHHAMPRPLRRGRNDFFFERVRRAEERRGGTAVPRPG